MYVSRVIRTLFMLKRVNEKRVVFFLKTLYKAKNQTKRR